MASTAVVFDPSSAKLDRGTFNPSSTKLGSGTFNPATAKLVQRPPIASGPLGTSMALTRGLISGVGGIPGDLESMALGGMKMVGLKAGNEPNILPTSDTILNFLRPQGINPSTAETIGQIGSIAIPVGGGVVKAAKEIPRVIGKVAEVAPRIGRILPGATERAESTLAKVAKPTGNYDSMGQAILHSTVGDKYAILYDQRSSLLGKAAHIVDENERRIAFRKIYQDPQFEQLRKFEQTPLGKKLTQTTDRYSEFTKADPTKIPHAVFDTPESVRQFRTLLGGDNTKVEFYARQYAAESLNNIVQKAKNPEEVNILKTQGGNIAKALRDWKNSPQQEWLNEVPETKKAVDDFVRGFEDMAIAQRRLKIGVTALTAMGLGAGGSVGLSRFIPFRSLYGGSE